MAIQLTPIDVLSNDPTMTIMILVHVWRVALTKEKLYEIQKKKRSGE